MTAAVSSVPGLSIDRAIRLVGAVQFVNVLDFMMVMPMGPDFAQALDIETAHIGYIGAAYTFAAAVAGLASASFLDRFDRRKALAVALLGLAIGTFAGAFAFDLPSLLAARVLAGLFGGPATSIAVSIIADVVPPAIRGQAMGRVMGAFAVASVFGVPVGLELARLFGFRAPFIAVGALALVVTASAIRALPPLTIHLAKTEGAPPAGPSFEGLFELPVVFALLATAFAMVANFGIIPHMSTFYQFNCGYPRADLWKLYLVGGTISFFAMRLAGRASDRFGASRVFVVSTVAYVLAVTSIFVIFPPLLPVIVAFAVFMMTNSMRFAPLQSLASRVPRAHQRASFLSVQSAVQHIASSVGAGLSSVMLTTGEGGALIGMQNVGLFAVGLSAVVPFLVLVIERRVRAREAEEALARLAAAPATTT